jgi:hypothetical protein
MILCSPSPMPDEASSSQLVRAAASSFSLDEAVETGRAWCAADHRERTDHSVAALLGRDREGRVGA